MDIAKLKDILKENGVAGAGGAGFPSYAKLNDKAEVIILNCAECEPLLKVDRQLLASYAHEIVSALSLVTETLGAKEFIIGVKGSYRSAVDAVKTELESFKNGRIHILKEVYPAGDEVVLIYDATGRVVPAGGLPIDVGAIVFNVETALNVYYAVNENKPVTNKYLTVAGEVKNPQTLLVPIGTKFSDIIAYCGGKTCEDIAIIHGGPMTGRLSSEAGVVTKTSSAILVLPKDHYLIGKRTQKVTISAKRAMSLCCQCNTCTDLCSRNLLNHPIDPARFMRCISSTNAEVLPLVNTMYCSGCGLCEMYSCPQGLSPAALIGIYKSKLRKNGLKPERQPVPESAKPEREYRLVPMKRLTSRLDVAKYNIAAPLYDSELHLGKLKVELGATIGQPPTPTVNVGDMVKKGDLIAKASPDALSLALHAPIDGKVTAVTDKFIQID